MQLENITGRPPRVLPYLEQDFWKAFPKANASEFARFVALAKRGGPLMTGMIIADVPDRILLNMMQRCALNRNLISRRVSSTRERRWMSGPAGVTSAACSGSWSSPSEQQAYL